MVIYGDVVLALNFMVDFLLILGTNRLSGFPAEVGRAAAAAGIGGVYGFLCITREFSFLGRFFWRFGALVLMAGVAFGWNRSTLRRAAVFIVLSFALGGAALRFQSRKIWVLGAAAGLIRLLCAAGFRDGVGERHYIPVELHFKGKTMGLYAMGDTGNTLRDPVTGEQVMVAGADVAWQLLGLDMRQLQRPAESVGLIPGLRLIPYHAVGQPGGMMLALRFRGARVGKQVLDPLVAFAPQVLGRGEMYQMLTGGAV